MAEEDQLQQTTRRTMANSVGPAGRDGGPWNGYAAVLHHPIAARLLTAKAIADLGDYVGLSALLILAYHDTDSVLGPASVYAARTLPALLIATVFSGWLDVPPRRTALVALSVAAAALVTIPAVQPRHLPALMAAGLLGAVRAAQRSVHTAVIAESVDQPLRVPLFGLAMVANQLGQVIGILAGASVTIAFAPRAALIANAVAYGVAAVVFLGLPAKRHQRRDRPPATTGARIIWNQPVLRVLSVVVAATMLSSNLPETLAPEIASSRWLPLVMAASAVGGAVFALIAAGGQFLRSLRTQLSIAGALGLALTVAAAVVALDLGDLSLVLANALIGAGGGWLIGAQATFAELAPPRHMGQVEATIVATNILVSGCGALALGWLATTTGPAAAYATAGAVLLAVVLLVLGGQARPHRASRRRGPPEQTPKVALKGSSPSQYRTRPERRPRAQWIVTRILYRQSRPFVGQWLP
jgi:MFS family permease